MIKDIINIGIPSKGRLRKDVLNIFKKNKLKLISERLIVKETIEADELDELFGVAKAVPAPSPKPESVPVQPEAKAELKHRRIPRSKKSPIIPEPIPGQAPATSD